MAVSGDRTVATRTVAVAVATYNRPELLDRCLHHLAAQTQLPAEILVVDGAAGGRNESVTRAFAAVTEVPVRYLRNTFGGGTLATSRAIALNTCTSEILAFVDDDALAHESWLAELMRPYDDPEIAGVGGQVRNGIAGEESAGGGQIGMFLPNGTLTGNFAADPGRTIEVDHLMGASMSFRTELLRAQGGIHDLYPGPGLREDSDICLRLRLRGYRLAFAPLAVVDHLAGPSVRGHRFDLRYVYFANRNHLVLLRALFGRLDPRLPRYGSAVLRGSLTQVKSALRRAHPQPLRSRVGAVARTMATVAGLLVGFLVPPERNRPRL